MEINGVFDEGGVRGIALAGAAAATLDCRYLFSRAVGRSAGALVAARYTLHELEDEHAGLDWSRLLLRKGVTTCGDLPEGLSQVTSADLSHGASVAFPHCLAGYGQDPNTFPVARAVVMSAAVRFLFAPVPMFDTLTGERVLFSDGAMAANYPIGVIAKDRPVFGFRLSPDGNPHVHQAIHGPYGLAKAVITSGIRARYSLPRTIEGADKVISVPVRADLDFSVTRREAQALLERAHSAVLDQLEPAFSP